MCVRASSAPSPAFGMAFAIGVCVVLVLLLANCSVVQAQTVQHTASGPLAMALADTGTIEDGTMLIFSQGRTFSPFCKCLLHAKLNKGIMPDVQTIRWPTTDSSMLLPVEDLQECVQSIVDACVPGEYGQPKLFTDSVCAFFSSAATYINTFSFTDDSTVAAIGQNCAFDAQLARVVTSACKPVCVPGPDHPLRRDPDLGALIFNSKIFNGTWWEGVTEPCGAHTHPFGLCARKKCIEALDFYDTYYASGLSTCSFGEYLYMGEEGSLIAQRHFMRPLCAAASLEQENLTQQLKGQLQPSTTPSSSIAGDTEVDNTTDAASDTETSESFVDESRRMSQLLEEIQFHASVVVGSTFNATAWTNQLMLLEATTSVAALFGDNRPTYKELGALFMQETPARCKHVYELDPEEMMTFMRSMKTPANVMTRLQGINGRALISMDKSDMVAMNVPPEWYISWMADRKLYLEPQLPVSLDKFGQASTVQVAISIANLYNVDEEQYTFEASLDIVMMWTDLGAWANCAAEIREDGSVVERGETCKYIWQPNLRFMNARDVVVTNKHIWSHPSMKLAGANIAVRGKFFTSMSFKDYPHDSQLLTVSFSVSDSTGVGVKRSELVWSPVSCVYPHQSTSESISGWKVKEVRGYEIGSGGTDALVAKMVGVSGSLFYSLYRNIKHSMGDDFLRLIDSEVVTEHVVSYASCDMSIERNTKYYVYNFILMIMMFTVLSWSCFFIRVEELHDRCMLGVTIVLALNVYQLIINDQMPKTNYVNPMSRFVIVSVGMVAFSIVESIVVFICNSTLQHQGKVAAIDSVTSLGGGGIIMSSPDTQGHNSFGNRSSSIGAGTATAGTPTKSSLRALRRTIAFLNHRVMVFVAKYLDLVCLVLFPIIYGTLVIVIFSWSWK